jgi:uncharacterized membrane protein
MMMWSLISIGVIVLIVVLVGAWYSRGRTKKGEDGPMVGNLGTAEDVMRLDQMHEQGKISDEEYHAARSKLLS